MTTETHTMKSNNLIDLVRAADETRDRYLVEIRFLDRVLGTQPKSAEIMRPWLEAKLAKEAAVAEAKGLPFPTETQRAEIVAMQVANASAKSTDEQLDDAEDKAWTGFFCDNVGLWLGAYQVNAAMRDVLVSTGFTMANRGSKQTFQHLTQVWAINPDGQTLPGEQGLRIRFWRDGKLLTEPDGYVEMTAHVQTAQGPRSVIKRHDYVEHATCFFAVSTAPKSQLRSREKAHIGPSDLAQVLSFMQGNALGCSRSQGFGVFEVVNFAGIE